MDDPPRCAWDFSFVGIDGQPLPLARYRGSALLIVNTASKCGFTPQYKGLEAVYETYLERGLTVLGVPCDDFGGQEPGDSEEILQFCESTYRVRFPLTEKVKVKGEGAHPFYRWAARSFGPWAKPRWNFHKYLIAPDGRLADWFSTVTKPTSPRFIKGIEAVLPR
ncbi:glutathione peroxidase [Telmatospirillum siberiense]|uniref:Glutathione peroxidase n=1 Tax=Telmatospirillum siberiense TaxID=382514 RepID=A0A2N3PRS0_9PROT|nr:glutathione peroxidase [Telmatospirillum siberiense]PKU23093.1 glutathione peroxidase [Telmatospirillum siberiense]